MKSKVFYFSLVIAVIALVINIIAYPYLPDKVPVHWGLNGEVNRYGSKLELVFIGVIPLIILFIQKGLPKIDPRRESYNKHTNAYSSISLILIIFLTLMNLVTILNALGYKIPFTKVVPVLMGLLFIGIGNYSTQLRNNYFIGFRTPWALASEYVWKKTHRFGGYVFVILGFIPLLTIIIGTIAMKIFFVALIIAIAAIYLYSYKVFKKNL